MNFTSDNVAPAHPKILEAILTTNQGYEPAYGVDGYSHNLQKRLSDVFEKEASVFLTNTGTASNCLALSSMVRPYEAIYCYKEAHIATDEGNAPEFFTSGAKLVLCDGENGKIAPLSLESKISEAIGKKALAPKPGCISITQSTESGTVYTIDELSAISQIAQRFNLPVHMDGARFANSLVSLSCSPAELTWKQGIDILSFGATKNGTVCAEAVIIFNPKMAENFEYLHKRSGQTLSKARFFSCQILEYLEDDLWLKNASHANAMAQKLAHILTKNQIEILYPVDANEIFFTISSEVETQLRNQGCKFYKWHPTENVYRFVTSFYTTDQDIYNFDLCLQSVLRILETDVNAA